MIHVYFIYGLGGEATSPGIRTLHDECKKIPGVQVYVPVDQSEWETLVEPILKVTGEPIVLIGYSMGANNITHLASFLGHVDLLCAIQPTLYEAATPIGPNVAKAIEFYNPNVLETEGLGSKKLIGNHVEYVVNSDSHPYADNDPAVHTRIINEIRKLV